MKIEIFYSKSISDPYFKPISELEYEKVHEYEHFEDICCGGPNALDVHLEDIFSVFQDERTHALGLRSLSVGDVVIFDSEIACYCHSYGWVDVTKQMIPSGSNSIGFKEV